MITWPATFTYFLEIVQNIFWPFSVVHRVQWMEVIRRLKINSLENIKTVWQVNLRDMSIQQPGNSTRHNYSNLIRRSSQRKNPNLFFGSFEDRWIIWSRPLIRWLKFSLASSRSWVKFRIWRQMNLSKVIQAVGEGHRCVLVICGRRGRMCYTLEDFPGAQSRSWSSASWMLKIIGRGREQHYFFFSWATPRTRG